MLAVSQRGARTRPPAGKGSRGRSQLDRWLQSRWQKTASRVPGLPRRSPHVLYRSVYTDLGEYGREARAMLLALLVAGYTVRSVGPTPGAGWGVRVGFDERTVRRLTLLHLPVARQPRLEIGHVRADTYMPVVPGAYRIGRVMFETDRLPGGWVDVCRQLDQVWVPSRFNLETFRGAGVEPHKLRVIPVGVDTGVFRPDAPPALIAGAAGFKFLSAFAWQQRSGWPFLIEGFVREFSAGDGVCLVIQLLPGSPGLHAVRRQLNGFIDSLGIPREKLPPIIVEKERGSPQELAGVYASCNAFVLPTRGEAWGFPFLEAMASGLPVIGTRWGGHLDFMDDGNARLIDVEELEVIGPDVESAHLYAGHRWARPSVAHLRRLMREVVGDRKGAAALGARARRDVERQWDVRATSRRFLAEMARSVRAISRPPGMPGRAPDGKPEKTPREDDPGGRSDT